MSADEHATLDMIDPWGRVNEELIQLVDLIPDDKLEWSPKERLWNLRGIVLHIAMARHNWLANVVQDEGPPDTEAAAAALRQILTEGGTKDGMKRQLAATWERMSRFLSAPAKLSKTYSGAFADGPEAHSGHWIAFHLLEHDIHHRADIFHYLALLGIEHLEVGAP